MQKETKTIHKLELILADLSKYEAFVPDKLNAIKIRENHPKQLADYIIEGVTAPENVTYVDSNFPIRWEEIHTSQKVGGKHVEYTGEVLVSYDRHDLDGQSSYEAYPGGQGAGQYKYLAYLQEGAMLKVWESEQDWALDLIPKIYINAGRMIKKYSGTKNKEFKIR